MKKKMKLKSMVCSEQFPKIRELEREREASSDAKANHINGTFFISHQFYQQKSDDKASLKLRQHHMRKSAIEMPGILFKLVNTMHVLEL